VPAKRSRSEPARAAALSGETKRASSADGPAGRPSRRARAVRAEVYNAFINGLDLVAIRLARATIEAASTPERRQLVPSTDHTARYENQDGHVLVFHDLGFTGTYEEDDEPAVSIRAEFEVKYSAEERMTDEVFAEFRRLNLPLNTWPYFREFVHAALARTGWPVFVLPVHHAMGAPLSPAKD
jgi:hypothetical protein